MTIKASFCLLSQMNCTADGNKEFKDQMGIKGFPSFRMFEGTLESAKEHKPPRVMPQLMEYFKAIKGRVEPSPRRRSSAPVAPSGRAGGQRGDRAHQGKLPGVYRGRVRRDRFYAPWCGHCKKLLPEYTKASKELKAIDPTIKLGKLDMDNPKEKAVGSKYGVKGFPALEIFRNGKLEDYTGPRDAEGIVKCLTNLKRPPPADDLDDDGEFDDDGDDEDDAKNMGSKEEVVPVKDELEEERMEEAFLRNPPVVSLGVTTPF